MKKKKTYDYSQMDKLVEQKSKEYKSNYDFAMYLSERMEYFSDRFGKEHQQYFDLLWKELKKRLNIQEYTGMKDVNGIDITVGCTLKHTSDKWDEDGIVIKLPFKNKFYLKYANGETKPILKGNKFIRVLHFGSDKI